MSQAAKKTVSINVNESLIHKTTTSKAENKEVKQSLWGDGGKKEFGFWFFLKFTWPFLWKGGWLIKIQSCLTFFFLILSKIGLSNLI